MKYLIKNFARDYHQLMEKAQKYIRLDDEKQAKKAEKRDEKGLLDGRRIPRDRGKGVPHDSGRERFQNYTPLTESRSRVLMWIQKNSEHIKYPRRMNPNTTNGKDKNKFYRFHDGYNYTKYECQNLKDKIEKLVKKGVLNRFTRRSEDERAKFERKRATTAPKC